MNKHIKNAILYFLVFVLIITSIVNIKCEKTLADGFLSDVKSGKCGENLTWEIDTDTATLTISGTGPMYNYSGPYSPWNRSIYGLDGISNIKISQGVTTIGDSAFWDNSNVEGIVIPNSVTSIGENAFYGNYSLKNIEIPNSVTKIGKGAFENCRNLDSINLPNKLSKVEEFTFWRCSNLKEVKMPESLVAIGNNAFRECVNLLNVTLPNGLIEIEDSVFGYCTKMADITIPNSVINIGSWAFINCNQLKNIQLGYSLQSIGEDAFENCYELSNVNYMGTVDKWCQINFLSDCSNPCIYANSLYVNNNLLTKADLSDKVTKIKDYAFYNCNSLTEVKMQDTVTDIGNYAFYSCYNLQNINIPNKVSNIGEEAFCRCKSLTSIDIPGSVNTINEGAFAACTGLIDINIREGVVNIADNVFQCDRQDEDENKRKLINVFLPNSVKSIGCNAFDNEFLESITISNSNCEIYDSQGTISTYFFDDETIYGWSDSTAEEYANKYLKQFVSIGEQQNSAVGTHNEFVIGKNNNSFAHSSNKDIFANAGFGKNYVMNSSHFDNLIDGASLGERWHLLNKMYSNWKGSCHGISTTMGLTYLFDYDDYYAYAPPLNDDLLSDIQYYQLSQYLTRYNQYDVSYRRDGTGSCKNLKSFLLRFINELSEGDILRFSYGTFTGGHSILALDYEMIEQEGEKYYKIRMYDENSQSKYTNKYKMEHPVAKDCDGEFTYLYVTTDLNYIVYYDNYTYKRALNPGDFTYISYCDFDNVLEADNKGSARLEDDYICFQADEKFELVNEYDDTLIYDGQSISGTMNIQKVTEIVNDEGTQYLVQADNLSEITFTPKTASSNIDIYRSYSYYSISSSNIEKAEIFLGDGKVNLYGSDYQFKISTGKDIYDTELLNISANAEGDVVLATDSYGSTNLSSTSTLNNIMVTSTQEIGIDILVKGAIGTSVEVNEDNETIISTSDNGEISETTTNKNAETTTMGKSDVITKPIQKTAIDNSKTVNRPKGTKVIKLKPAKKSLKVTWKKIRNVHGYQIQYSTSKKFNRARNITIKRAKITSKTIKKLKSKKKYYIRIRTYNILKGKKNYSAWSKPKNKKTK